MFPLWSGLNFCQGAIHNLRRQFLNLTFYTKRLLWAYLLCSQKSNGVHERLTYPFSFHLPKTSRFHSFSQFINSCREDSHCPRDAPSHRLNTELWGNEALRTKIGNDGDTESSQLPKCEIMFFLPWRFDTLRSPSPLESSERQKDGKAQKFFGSLQNSNSNRSYIIK